MRHIENKMKIIWYRVSSKCSDKWEDEASREYIERPVHLIREQDKQCMACLRTYADATRWVSEYQERMGNEWRVKDIAILPKLSDAALKSIGRTVT